MPNSLCPAGSFHRTKLTFSHLLQLFEPFCPKVAQFSDLQNQISKINLLIILSFSLLSASRYPDGVSLHQVPVLWGGTHSVALGHLYPNSQGVLIMCVRDSAQSQHAFHLLQWVFTCVCLFFQYGTILYENYQAAVKKASNLQSFPSPPYKGIRMWRYRISQILLNKKVPNSSFLSLLAIHWSFTFS